MKKLLIAIEFYLIRRRANILYKRNNVQYFIMKAENYKKANFVIVDEAQRQRYNVEAAKKGLKQFSKNEIKRNCIWCTKPERSYREL